MSLKKILIGSLIMLTLSVNAAAYQVSNLDTDLMSPYYGMNVDSDAQAHMLHELGLFRGTDRGYELERSMNRCEAAAMLVRLLGQEASALEGTHRHPFDDVPAWADPYVAWLWENGLTRGVSPATYGAHQAVTCKQYLLFISRVLQGPNTADDWWQLGTGRDLQALQQSLDQRGFTRGDAVSLSALALTCNTQEGITLAARLISEGTVSKKAFQTSSFPIYGSTYFVTEEGVPVRRTAGVEFSCPASGLTLIQDAAFSPRPYFFAVQPVRDALQVYIIDCESMTTLNQITYPVSCSDVSLSYTMQSHGNRDYFLEHSKSENGMKTVDALLSWDGNRFTRLLSADQLQHASESADFIEFNADGETLLVSTSNRTGDTWGNQSWILQNDSAIKIPVLDNSEVLDLKNDIVVAQRIGSGKTDIFQATLSSNEVLACFTAKWNEFSNAIDFETGNPVLIRRSISKDRDAVGYWGSAGLYQVKNGSLVRTLDLPIDQILSVPGGGCYLLSHTPNFKAQHASAGMDLSTAGNEIFHLASDGTLTTALSAQCGHDIIITNLDGFTEDGFLQFSYQKQVYQQIDSTSYILEHEGISPSIRVVQASVAYPEVHAALDEIPAYLEQIAATEQQRLNQLGIGII